MGVIWTTFCGGKEQVREGHFKTTMIVFILMSHCASNRGRSVISLKTSFSLSLSLVAGLFISSSSSSAAAAFSAAKRDARLARFQTSISSLTLSQS